MANTTTGYGGTYGAGIIADDNSSYSGCNNIVYFNEAITDPGCSGPGEFSYTCNSQNLPGIGNINDDPMFNDPDNHDYSLMENSPCIDAGDPASQLDPEGTIADMGALYYHQNVGVEGNSNFTLSEFHLSVPFPNPFNNHAVIEFTIAKSCNVTISIYDVTGREARMLFEGAVDAGLHSIEFDGAQLTSGIYFVRMEAAGYSQAHKVILLK